MRLFGEAPAPPAEIESREKKMAQTFTGRKRVRKFFGKITEVAEMPNLIEVQKASYDQFLMVDEPKGAIFGGVVAAPAFAQIAKFDLQYLEIPPDEKPDPRTTLSAG